MNNGLKLVLVDDQEDILETLEIKIPDNKAPIELPPSINNATPKLAPELIPKTKGPASGFRNKVCIKSPEIPNPLPTIIAVIAFGNL